jgi:hypothetical protein
VRPSLVRLPLEGGWGVGWGWGGGGSPLPRSPAASLSLSLSLRGGGGGGGGGWGGWGWLARWQRRSRGRELWLLGVGGDGPTHALAGMDLSQTRRGVPANATGRSGRRRLGAPAVLRGVRAPWPAAIRLRRRRETSHP